MTFYYTARATYDKNYDIDGRSWDKFTEWSKLNHLTELVSLDCMHNELLVESDHENQDYWNYCVIDEHYETGFFTTMDYVLQNIKQIGKFNFLAVVIEPSRECIKNPINNFDFVGYDLLDKSYDISALTNCGGFDETFSPTDLNQFGLVDDFEKAYDIKKRLLENNPKEYHAETNVIGVYRHKTIGR